MSKQNRTTLKGYFEVGDVPSQGQYHNFIDSKLNLADTGTQIVPGTISSSFLEVQNHITSSGNLFVSGNVSASTATFLTVDTGQGANELYSMNQNVLTTSNVQFNNITGSGISASGNILGNCFVHPINTAASQDLDTSTNYSVNGCKVEVRAITKAQINDGAFDTFKLLNTSIATDSIVLGSFTGTHATSSISGSILTAATIAANTASVFIHNETGQNIAANTPFTASFVVF